MKCVCFSDTHGQHRNLKIPPCDGKDSLLLFAGDVCGVNPFQDLLDFDKWLKTLNWPRKQIVVIAGNHEILLEKRLASEPKNCVYLFHSFYVYRGAKIFGSPFTPRFLDWAFNAERGEALCRKWKQIPCDTTILVTHGPPYGIADEVSFQGQTENMGDRDLRERLLHLTDLKLHVFGHNHSQGGTIVVQRAVYVNASVLNERYQLVREAVQLEI
jgi:predicted phosphodiesterase